MLNKKLKKILLVLLTFIGACFYLIGNSISEGISSISGRKPAELKIKVTKRNSKAENMYIDREANKIFYFFGNEGLINGDFVNITEKPSDPNFISRTLSKISGNTDEIRVSNYGESKNLKYSVKKGEIKNRAIIKYLKRPKNIYVEFYDVNKKLKKIVKNDFKDIKIENIYGNLNEKTNEIELKYNKEKDLNNDLKDLNKQDKIEIFSDEIDGEKIDLKYTINEINNQVGVLKINLVNNTGDVYIAIFTNQGELKNIYRVKPRILKADEFKNSYITWNTPSIDITAWDRKDIPKNSKMKSNTEFSYGTEKLPNGEELPYIDIKMGRLLIPTEQECNKVSITSTNNKRTTGHVLLSNIRGEKLSGRVYLTTTSQATKEAVKGLDYNDIVDSTSTIEFLDNETKEADIRLRLYDSSKNLDSLFVAGILNYIENSVSTSSIDIGKDITINYVEKLPKVEILDLRDDLKENIFINKKTIDLSEEIGKNIGDNIVWDSMNSEVDIKLAEIELQGFQDKTGKIKNPYLEILTDNQNLDKKLISGQITIIPMKYFLKVVKGNTKEIDAINYGNEKIGYKKISATSMDGKVSPIKADAYVKISRKDFEALKTSTTDTIQFKASESNLEEISITFNEDYAEKILKVPYNDFKIYKVNTDRKNNVVNLDGTIFFNEIKENKIDLVFDSTKNSTGKIGVRGISQLINSQLNDLSGNSVFDMTNGIISREYSDTDVLSLESPEGITEFKQTTAKPSVEGYQSATFKARNMEFELKIWNNTNKIELKVLKGSSSPQEGEISGVIKQKDENGDIHNTINLNLYSSTRVISMDGDSLKIWRNYSPNLEWNTEVEIVNTTDNNSTPTGEGGLKSRKIPFLSYKGDEVTLEPIKRGQEGIEERSIKFLKFTDESKNLGILDGKKLIFDELGQGSVRLELTLTKDLIESLFPQDKNHTTYKDVEVAEIVFGKGKRRVPVKVRIQLRYIIPNVSDNSTPVRVISEHSKKNYYNMGLYPKEKTIKIKDITPGSEREIAIITPETTTVSGIIPEIGGTKEFRGKNIKTDIQVTIGSGTLNNAGIYLGDIILNDKSQLFGVFTMIDGTQEIKEYEIWIPKYSPIQETESITSDFITNKNGNPNTYTKSLSIIRYNEDDYTTSIGVKELLGKISLLGKTKDRASDIKRNSSTLNIAKLPDSIKLIGQDTSLTEVIGHLSFSDDKIQLDAEQLEGVDKELSIYLFISSEEAKKLIPNEEYEIKGEFLAGRISNGSVSGSNLLYYGLKTDNTSDLGLDEYLYEPVFNLNIKTNTLEKKLLRIDLDNGKPLLKSKGIEKTMRILKGEGKYSIDVEGSFNYSEIKTSGMMNKYNPKREEFENKNHEVRVTDISTGKVFKGEVNSKGGSINVETDIANLELVYSDNSNLTIGMDTKDSLEILNIGISEYKLKKGDIKLLIEHLDSEAPFNVITKDEINIKIPDFEPKKWYLSSQSSIGNNEKLVGKLTNFSSNNLYFEIGEIKLKKIDKEITKSTLDSEGLRIEYDSSIELTKKDDPNIKIQGKIVQIDLNGSVLNGNALKTDGKLAILIDKTQEGYNQNSVYTYDQGSMDLSSETTNKPIRIGVNGNWHGLIKNIEILPVKDNEAVLTKWNSGLVDISDWTRKARNSSLNTNVSYGTEVFTSGVTVPYVDVQMGEILILSESSANTIRIKRLKNDDKIGSVILQKEDGKNITGKIYLKTSSSGGTKPVKGYNNKDIPDSVSNIIFSFGENKIAQVYLRIYDINENEKSLITAGKLSYLKSVYSSIDIEILENNSLILTDSTIPEVEILDLRDTLKEKIRMNKISMDFTGEIGSNIADDVVWVLGSRYVDLKLMNFSIENMVEKTGKLKNPSVNIDTVNEVPNYVLQGDSQSYDIFRYYSKINAGKTVEIDEIKHAGITLGYKKISAISDSEENLSEISGDVYIRVTREVYEELKKDSSKIFKLKRKEVVPSEKNGESAELEIVFNEDYPEQSVKVPYGDFKTIKEESDREGNTVDLKTLIYPKEIKENLLNLVFDSRDNSTGDISIRGTSAKINDIHSKLKGYSVFDMSKGILQSQYRDSDVIEVSGTITNTESTEVTNAQFSKDGYKSVKFVGTNKIVYELKIWNNTDKVEITVDKSNMTNETIDHEGIIQLKNSDGKVLNRINLSMSIYNGNILGAFQRTDVSGIDNGNLGVRHVYTYSAEQNTDIEVIDKGRDGIRQNGIKNLSGNLFKSYKGDKMYVEPIKGVGKEGIDGRWIEVHEFTSTHTQVGTVKDNRLELNDDGTGNARLILKIPKSWIENRWPDNTVKSFGTFEGLELVYANGKRRVPQTNSIALQTNRGMVDGLDPTIVELKEEGTSLSLATLYNNSAQNVEFQEKLEGEENFKTLYRINGVMGNSGTISVIDLELKGKKLKRDVSYSFNGNNSYGSAPLFFRDVPLVKERTVIGDYTAVRKGGSQQGLSYITLVIPKYSPLEYAYSRSSSLQIDFSSFTSKLNSIQLEFYREDVEDRTTTSEVIKEIGNISLLGRAKNDNNRILRSSKTLNILKLPDKVKLKRIENGILTKEIEGILSFDSNKIDLDFTQTSEKDTEAKIYLKISKEQAEQLDDKGIYLIEGEYSSGRISKDKVLTDSVVYLGLKTDNTSDLGFDEYIYEPAIKLNIQSTLVKDNSVKIALFDAGDQKPIPKNDGKNGLIRLYKTESQYSSEIEPNNYGKLVLRGYMNPYNYKRGDLSLNHTLKLTDESTTRSSSGTIDSNGGYVDLETNLGKISIGYSKDSSIANGMETTESMEITTFGIKEYKFTRGDIRILVDHFDNGNTMVPIYSEVLVVGIPAFEPKSWYYNESNSDKLTNIGVKYMKYFTKDKIVYPLGIVGLDKTRDRGITIGEDDAVGARIEYNKEIDLEEKNNPNKKIKGKIVKLDLKGNTLPKGNILSEENILPDEDILEEQVALGIEIDLNQVGHDSSKTYVLKGDSPLDVSSDITKKPIRIGRNGHWESLVTNVELRPVVMGDLTLNLTKSYFRNSKLQFNTEGQLISGSGASFSIQKNFINNIPTTGTIKVYKWGSDSNPYGEKLVEGNIENGNLINEILIDNNTLDKTNYKINISKLSRTGIEISLLAWGEDVLNEKLFIEVSDSLGVTSMNKFSLNYTESRSMLNIDYVSPFTTGNEFISGNLLEDSLYLGTILNPSSYKYQNERPQLESVNSLKVSYIGDDIGLVNAIQSVKLNEKNIELTNTMTGKKIEIEDISFHKVSKRYNSSVTAFFEEVYKMKGYIDFRKYLDLENGTYKGTVRLEIELN